MAADEVLARLLLDVAFLLALSQLLRLLLLRLHQPEVLAYVLAGVLLGPSLLGRLPSDPTQLLFPEPVREALAPIGTFGLVMFAFVIGLELDLSGVRRRSRSVLGVSAGALLVPLAAGAALAAVLYPVHSEPAGGTIPMLPFVLFLATAMAVTAFPVLVAIVAERGVLRSSLGQIAVSSAALQDGCGWVLLTLALAAIPGSGGSNLPVLALSALAFVSVLVVTRPLFASLLTAEWATGGEAGSLAVSLCYATACAGITQLIGLHVVLGAFAAGLAFPRAGHADRIRSLCRSLTPVTLAIFLPVYFLTPGLHLDVGELGAHRALELGAIVTVACLSKLGGGALAARASGMSWEDAGTLGILLNTRGLMELVVLTVGYTEGVFDRPLFTEMVMMAIVTTMMTGPLLEMLRRRGVVAAGAR